jgi:hypothetical protein
MPGPGSGCAGRAGVGCWSTASCVRWWRPSSAWSGARNRSPRGCAPHSGTGPTGTSATRASTRRVPGRLGRVAPAADPPAAHRPLRKRRRRATERQTWFVTPGRLIDQRPAVVLSRDPVGDWEGDQIVGRGNRSAIATLVNRPARSAIDAPLPAGVQRGPQRRGRRDRAGVLDSPAGPSPSRDHRQASPDRQTATQHRPGLTRRHVELQIKHSRDKSPTATHQQQMCNSTAPCSTKAAPLT